MKVQRRLISLILVTILFFLSNGSSAMAQPPAPTPFANCRLGVGGLSLTHVGAYDITQLNIGRYHDWWNSSDPHSVLDLGLPADIEYLQTVHVHQDKGDEWWGPPRVYASDTYKTSPGLSQIATIAASQRGSLWLIGNEIDRVDWWDTDGWGGQNEITPEVYATAFHEIRDVIKTADPTARIGIGSVVQTTPLRLEYLDRVWNSYVAQYGYSMGKDIDVWNIHGFILREVWGTWGADVPAGLGDPGGFGFLSGADIPTVLAAHHDLAYFQEFTEAFREWMAAHGERNKPLINTEYGILYKSLSGYNITDQQVNDFLTGSLYYLLTATDEETGFPADNNRLVQSWFWYSLNDEIWNGNLFNPNTNALTGFGTTWKDFATHPGNPMASQPQQNLLVANLRAEPNQFVISPGETVTVTLFVDVANSGNIATSTGNKVVVEFWDGLPNAAGSNLLATRTVDDLPGCGGFTTVEAEWPNRGIGVHTWYAEVGPIPSETDYNDNTARSVVRGAGSFMYLPIIMKKQS
jgi:hypothetical protein